MKFFIPIALCAVAIAAQDNVETEKRLIRFSDTKSAWLTPDEIEELTFREIGFVDDTEGYWTDLGRYGVVREALHLTEKTYPDGASFSPIVNKVIAKIQTSDLKNSLTEFVTKFSNRYYTSSEGKQSCGWIYDQIDALISANTRTDIKITARKFQHSWGQYSVIARVEPTKNNQFDDILIASAHQDSINRRDLKNAPGADDDGSGSITILQSLKYLLDTPEWQPTRPIEIHWYSGEEVGLKGSVQVAREYASKNVDVYAQMQQDMTGWVAPGTEPVVSFMDDYTNADLNTFLENLVDEYLDIPATHGRCGYGCSDHASWHKAGYPASMPFETNFRDLNPNIHSTRDSLSTIDFNHMAEFTKLTVSYLIELSQAASTNPTNAPSEDPEDPIIID